MQLKKLIQYSLVVTTLGTAAFAEEASIVKNWEYHNTNDLCYGISFATNEDKNSNTKRYLTITNRPSENRKNELAFVSGFPEDYQLDGSVTVDGNLPFKLLTYKGVGFVKSGDIESMLVAQMKAGVNLEIKWTNLDGEYIVDRYSLLGFTAAHKNISNCK